MALNVIALISGGKDSFFSILHCIANGHNIIALANLHPSPTASDNEDINSYMYQTVGHSVIPLYEQALGIPLYRQEITGKAVNSARDYSAPRPQQEQDETEDLVPLLRKVMLAHPEANAVCSGAILSTYQRTRVESVALRLGLTPLAYLWQYPLLPPYSQSQLLRDMAAVGQEAVVIKTASGGLDERILGWNVAALSTITKLQKAMARFGEESNGAVLGEGGEFETLALDGPGPLWKKRIRIEPGAAGLSEGGQSVLKLRASELEDKSGESSSDWIEALRIPEMFDDEFKRLLEDDQESTDTQSFISDDATLLNESIDTTTSSTFDHLPRNASADTPTLFTYSNLSDTSRSKPNSASPARQLTKLLLRLDHVLKQWQLSRGVINHCTLLLRSMSDFSILNPIYGQYFSGTNPPARVTVAVGDSLPEGIDVMLSIIIDKDARDKKGKVVRAVERQGLHVQGRSYWAPANIGPYSQAISARLPGAHDSNGEVVYVAGQIPLVPASMEVYTQHGFQGQVVLSLQHLWRVGRAKGVRCWTAGVGFLPACENPEEKVRIAQQAWRAIHARAKPSTTSSSSSDVDSDDDANPHIDPWDARNTHIPLFNDTPPRPCIPARLSSDAASTPPCFIVQVGSLPRDVAIEWSATGLTLESDISHSALARLSITTPVPVPVPVGVRTSSSSSSSSPDQNPNYTSSHSHGHGAKTRFYTFELHAPTDALALRHLGQESVRGFSSATLYATASFEREMGNELGWRGVQWVPCKRVWGEGGRECRGVLVGRWDGGGGVGVV